MKYIYSLSIIFLFLINFNSVAQDCRVNSGWDSKVTYTPNGQISATLSFDRSFYANSYQIQYGSYGNINYSTPYFAGNSFTIDNLNQGVEYTWIVVPNCPGSQPIEQMFDTYNPKPFECKITSGWNANPFYNNDQIDVSLSFNGLSNYANYYYIEYGENGYTNQRTNNFTGNRTLITNLKPNTEYTWVVRPYCSNGNQSFEHIEQTFRTPQEPTCQITSGWNVETSYDNIGDLNAVLSFDGIDISDDYRIHYGTNGNTYYRSSYFQGTRYTIDNLQPETEYTWYVETDCHYIFDDPEPIFQTFTTSREPVCQITSGWNVETSYDNNGELTAVFSFDGVGISDRYRIEYKESNRSYYTNTSYFTGTSYTIDNLDPETEYNWYVETDCHYSFDDSEPLEQTFTTPPEPVCQITSGWEEVVNLNDGNLLAQLSFDGLAYANNYYLYYGEVNGNMNSIYLNSSTTSYTVNGLNGETEYVWYVEPNCNYGYKYVEPVKQYFTTEAIPKCKIISGWNENISYNFNGAYQAELSFDGIQHANNYELRISENGGAQNVYYLNTSTSYIIQNLRPETNYSWWIEPDCNSGYEFDTPIVQEFTTDPIPTCQVNSGWNEEFNYDNGAIDAIINFDSIKYADYYQIIYGRDSYEETTNYFTETNFTLRNLEPETDYIYYVKPECDNSLEDANPIQQTFTTPPPYCRINSGWNADIKVNQDKSYSVTYSFDGLDYANFYEIYVGLNGNYDRIDVLDGTSKTVNYSQNYLPTETDLIWYVRPNCDYNEYVEPIEQTFQIPAIPDCQITSGWDDDTYLNEDNSVSAKLNFDGIENVEYYRIFINNEDATDDPNRASYVSAGGFVYYFTLSSPPIFEETEYVFENLDPETNYSWFVLPECSGVYDEADPEVQYFETPELPCIINTGWNTEIIDDNYYAPLVNFSFDPLSEANSNQFLYKINNTQYQKEVGNNSPFQISNLPINTDIQWAIAPDCGEGFNQTDLIWQDLFIPKEDYEIAWQDLVGLSTTSENGLDKSGTSTNWDAGAASSNKLAAGEDGFIEFTIQDVTSKFMYGFSKKNIDEDYKTIAFAAYQNQNELRLYNSSANLGSFGTLAVGDVIRVARISDEIVFFHNAQEIHRIATDNSFDLLTDASIHTGSAPNITTSFPPDISLNAFVTGVEEGTQGALDLEVQGGETPYAFSWNNNATTEDISGLEIGEYSINVTDNTNLSNNKTYYIGYNAKWAEVENATIGTNNNLIIDSGVDNWKAGASSDNMLKKYKDGFIEFIATDIDSRYMVGLSNQNSGTHYNGIKYAFYINNNKLLIYESGTNIKTVSALRRGDILRIGREGESIVYYLNGKQERIVNSIDNTQSLIADVSIAEGSVPNFTSSFDIDYGEGEIPDLQEYEMLKELFISTQGENWINNENWPYENWPATVDNAEFDSWFGVIVEKGDITGIELPSNALTGSLPVSVLNHNKINLLDFNDNSLTDIDGEITFNRTEAIEANLKMNFFDFGHFERLKLNGLANDQFNEQKNFSLTSADQIKEGEALELLATADKGANGNVFWQKKTDTDTWEDVTSLNEAASDLEFLIAEAAIINEGTYRWSMTNGDFPNAVLFSDFSSLFVLDDNEKAEVNNIPEDLKASSNTKYETPKIERQFYLNELSSGDQFQLFEAPPCLDGQYYASFQLEYDLSNLNTLENWSAFIDFELIFEGNTVFTGTTRVESLEQTMISSDFYDALVSCSEDYQINILTKNLTGPVPEEAISFKIIFERYEEEPFDPAMAISSSCQFQNNEVNLNWDPAFTHNIASYELEWVQIKNWENFNGTTAQDAFNFKEGVSLSLQEPVYQDRPYYQDSKLYYRVRAIGYNPEYPSHQIPGNWHYFDCEITVNNHNPQLNWQSQTTFAEEGKYKKIMKYFDGTLRERQILTNLNSEEVTLVAENLYDYEGRKSASIMPAPAADNSLVYKADNYAFESQDQQVADETSAIKEKFHYDNHRVENSILAQTVGASQYYSANNQSNGFMKDYIPEANGYLLSQTEFTHDGTGRVSRQSGVGETFKMDGEHATRYFYGEATQEELIRLFGSNVGDARHYKKNLVVDPNGQVSVSYLTQEDKTIATALAGTEPENLDALASLEALNPETVTADVTHKNQIQDGELKLKHVILNTSADENYTINYDLSALGDELARFGCQGCAFDLSIIIKNPQGEKMVLNKVNDIPENEAEANEIGERVEYYRSQLIADDCATPTVLDNISFQIELPDIGNYTIEKVVSSQELSYEELEQIVLQDEAIQTEIETIRETYSTSAEECVLCTGGCDEQDAIIQEAMQETAVANCENMYNNIIDELRQQSTDGSEPSEAEIEGHPDYCAYELCVKDQLSDVFEMEVNSINGWNEAVSAGYDQLLALDPFFNSEDLSGFDYKADMENSLSNLPVATIEVDTDDDDEADRTDVYEGALADITDPDNTDYYINENGENKPNGRHILYMELMAQQGAMDPADYDARLNQERWSLFKSFYFEAKRRLKLDKIEDYYGCSAAREQLETTDELPVYHDDIVEWADGQPGGTGPVSTAEVSMSFSNIAFNCGTEIEPDDQQTIKDHLKAYFNSDPMNMFRLFLREDIGTSDPIVESEWNEDLLAIQYILEEDGCSLVPLAQDNPLQCVETKTVRIPARDLSTLEVEGQILNIQRVESSESSLQEKSTQSKLFNGKSNSNIKRRVNGSVSNEVKSIDRSAFKDIQTLSDFRKKRKNNLKQQKAAYFEEKDSLFRIKKENYFNNRKIIKNDAKDAKQSNLRPKSSILTNTNTTSQTVSQQEYDALMEFYNAMDGPNWTINDGWGGPIETVSDWYGIEFGDNGIYYRIDLQNNGLVALEDKIPESFNNLTKLLSLNLSDNNIVGLNNSFGENFLQLNQLNLRNTQISLLPDNFCENCTSLADLNLSDNQISQLPFNFGENWSNIRVVDLSINLLSQFDDNFGQNWTQVNMIFIGNNQISQLPNNFGEYWTKLFLLYIHSNQISVFPSNFGQTWTGIEYLRIQNNKLSQLPNNFGDAWSSLKELYVFNNELSQFSSDFGVNWLEVTDLILYNNSITQLPDNFGENWVKLNTLQLNENQLSELPDNFGENWVELNTLQLNENQLSELPDDFGNNWSTLQRLDLFSNNLENNDISAGFGLNWLNLTSFGIANNNLSFEGLDKIAQNLILEKQFSYRFQTLISKPRVITTYDPEIIRLTADIDRNTKIPSEYKWKRTFNRTTYLQSNFSQNNAVFDYNILYEEFFNAEYSFEIINSEWPNLYLYRDKISIKYEDPYIEVTYCAEYDLSEDNTTLANWSYDINWDLELQQCRETAEEKDELIVQRVIDKRVEEEVGNYYNTYSTSCLSNIDDQLTLEYAPIEYHYTLYYYDQSNNLVQTVPPAGVNPLTDSEVQSFLSGTITEPAHELKTKYQYNSLNQLVSQQTPDAGNTDFLYNKNGQLRLSQNAQQAVEGKMSYTKYDVLGRTVEVGEMASANTPNDFETEVEGLSFPREENYTLSDITKTHYDFADPEVVEGIDQNHLRNRVAYTEVQNADEEEYVKTWYSYDAHGNVNTLAHALPGFEPKRINYQYDLISGNVKGVFYQEGKEDGFMHRYEYDDDNRITEVYTSTDGYIWNREAGYRYYQHGPLARTELGNYRVQGLDYLYTLQGWIKGVNSPISGDPANDGSTVKGADAMSYTLGYYENDYTPIGATPTNPVSNLGSSLQSFSGNANALYNGNIGWMATDLPGLGLENVDRTAGMQAMEYHYDQLNRITKGLSLTNFTEGTGFAGRDAATASPYDASYSYDANGNLLSLERNDEASEIQDDFDYEYYAGTNQLRALAEGAPDAYIYDEIGNMVEDVQEGASIDWTPYGKIRTVTKDGLTIEYRYDAAGNRIAKIVEKDGEVSTNRYIRDASGNVMTVYRETEAIEHHVYGSSRLGLALEKAKPGQLKLGHRQYELSNHLGNVLAVVTDNVNMTTDTENSQWYDSQTWPTLIATNDYYPFGLAMGGRTSQLADANGYRYGFNGKELDDFGALANGGGAEEVTVEKVAAYSFNGSAVDNTGNGQDGTVNGASLTEGHDGAANSAYAFDGDNDYIELSNTQNSLSYIQNTGVFTISAWVKINDLEARSAIVSSTGTTAEKGFLLMYETYGGSYGDHQLRLSMTKGVTGEATIALGAPYTIDDNNWHHVAVVGDGNNIRFYVDGEQDGNATTISQFSSGDASRNTAIGISNGSTGSYYLPLHGEVDGLSFYNTTLSSTEINYLYTGDQVQEDTPEAGTGPALADYNHYDYGFRIYNPRIAKFLSVDPLSKSYPMLTPYQYASNTPIMASDFDGLEGRLEIQMRHEDLGLLNGTITADEVRENQKARGYGALMGAGLLIDVFVTKGYISKFLAAHALGNVVHSAQMQTHYRDMGMPDKADEYKQEGGQAVTELTIEWITHGMTKGVAKISKNTTIPFLNNVDNAARGSLNVTAKNASTSEVRAAHFMKDKGFNVELRDPVGTRAGGGTSDLLVDGVAYDVYTPISTNPNRIISAIAKKNTQASGVVLDLSNTSVTQNQLGKVLDRVQGAGATNIKNIQIIGGN